MCQHPNKYLYVGFFSLSALFIAYQCHNFWRLLHKSFNQLAIYITGRGTTLKFGHEVLLFWYASRKVKLALNVEIWHACTLQLARLLLLSPQLQWELGTQLKLRHHEQCWFASTPLNAKTMRTRYLQQIKKNRKWHQHSTILHIHTSHISKHLNKAT
jgi:hypothetical protein